MDLLSLILIHKLRESEGVTVFTYSFDCDLKMIDKIIVRSYKESSYNIKHEFKKRKS